MTRDVLGTVDEVTGPHPALSSASGWTLPERWQFVAGTRRGGKAIGWVALDDPRGAPRDGQPAVLRFRSSVPAATLATAAEVVALRRAGRDER